MPIPRAAEPRFPRSCAAALAVAAAAGATLAGCQGAPRQPDARVTPIDGPAFQELVRSAERRPLVVNFWATWCEPCREEMPALEALHRDLGHSVTVVGVSVDDPDRLEQVLKYLSRQRVSFPQYIRSDSDDEAFIAAVDPEWSGAVPATFVYDVEGDRAVRLLGQQSRESLETALQPLLGGSASPDPPSARAAGAR